MDIYNDSFIEYLIKKKKDGKDYAIITLLALAAVVLTAGILLLTFMLMASGNDRGLGSSIGLVLVALVWYAWYLLKSMRNVEYEYIMTNSAMDIDKVMSKKGRKHLVDWDFKTIDLCARIDDPNYKHEYENTASRDKIYDLTGDKSRGYVYFVDYTSEDNVKTRVLFQPTSKMIETARKYNRRTVFVME